MRIAYTCHDAFPSSDTNTHQIFWTLTEVVRRGVDVELFTPQPAGGQALRSAITEYYGGDPNDDASLFPIKPVGHRPADAWIAKGWFDWRLPGLIPAAGHDLVWTRDLIAAYSCLRAGRRVLFETFRPDVATRPAFAVWRRHCLAHPRLCGIVTHSRLAAEAFIAAGLARERCLVAHNGFAPSLMGPPIERAAAREILNLPQGVPLVVYAGHVGPEKGTDALIHLAAAVPRATFLLLGIDEHSRDARWVADLAAKAGATNVLLRPRVRLAEVAPYLYAADCLIIPPTDEPLRRFGGTVLPLKVFTYMAAGRPILAPALPDIEEVLSDGVTARLVQPRPEAAAQALTELLADQTLQERLARNAAAEASRYTWAARARSIVDFVSRSA